MTDSKESKANNNSKKHFGIDLSNKKWIRNAFIVALGDIVATYFCFFMALLLRFDFSFSGIEDDYFEWYLYLAPIWCVIVVVVFFISRLYHSIWSFVSIDEALQVIKSYCIIAPLMVISSLLLKFRMPISFYIIGIVGCVVCHIGNRFAYRILRKLGGSIGNSNSKGSYEERVMIIGAGDSGSVLIKELKNSSHTNMVPICVIDDNANKIGRSLFGVPIVGGRDDIISKAAEYDIDTIIFAIPTASGSNRKAILNIAKETGCKLRTIPGVYQLASGEVSISRVRNVELNDLLGRDPITIDNGTVFNMIKGKTVLVTGGGGSIGSELCRQIASHDPKQLIIFDIYENNAYEIQQELLRKYRSKGLNLVTLIGSVRNTHRITSVMQEYKPDIVFHAAAHKHVPLMEDSPNEAIKNNVMGTYKTAKAAALAGVKKFVLISTDKAVNPTNIMGATKRICEMIIQMMDHETPNTSYVAVRFGNVLGSNGSVVPLFKKQIAEGGPVTVTHKDINRFFMTIPEAVSLVLQASYYAKGGEIFVLDMGEPVKIDDMARNLIKLSGLRPDIDIKIEYTGLRPGEKLYEEILMDEEGMQKTDNKLIYIGKPIDMDDEWFKEKLSELDRESRSDDKNIREIVQEIVPTYSEGNSIQKKQISAEKKSIPFSPPDISDAEINEVVEAMKSGWITTGPRVKLLERRLAAYIETGDTNYDTERESDKWSNRVVCLSSATAAEELNLRVLGIGEGDEVIVPAYSYTASASAAIHCGATVKFVDIQKDGDRVTHMPEMDYDALEKAITAKTKAIVTVDLAGIICDYERVFDIVERQKSLFTPKESDGKPFGDLSSRIQKSIGRVAVIADGAHTLGASRVFRGDKKYCGAIADFTSFSFHAVKNFTTAEGGAATWTNKDGIDNAEIYHMYQLLSLHGQSKDALAKTKVGAWEYDIVGPWYKCNMTDIMAAIGLRQLDRYAGLLNRRIEIIKKYDEACDRLGISHLVHHTDYMDSSNHLYLIRIPGFDVEKRNQFITKMAEQGVSTNVHYKPMPMMTAYKDLGWDIKDFPNTFDYYQNLVTLPLHTKLTDSDVTYIIDKLETTVRKN